MFGPILPALAEGHQVIAVDLQGHGRTADIDRPIDVRLMADDIAAFIDHLGLGKPDLVGYSLGSGVALHAAAKYPAKIRRLVVVSANIRPDAVYPEMRAAEPGERGRRRVHEGHADVPALPAGCAPPRGLPSAAGQDRRGDVEGLRLHRGGTQSPGADACRRRRCRHGAAEPPRRDLHVARRRPPRRRLDGRGPAGGRSRARDPARPDPLQRLRLAAVRRGRPRLPRRATELNPAVSGVRACFVTLAPLA
ncbi:MAG: alpha/beta fold hydrolase [Jiangellaceae bacterium]